MSNEPNVIDFGDDSSVETRRTNQSFDNDKVENSVAIESPHKISFDGDDKTTEGKIATSDVESTSAGSAPSESPNKINFDDNTGTVKEAGAINTQIGVSTEVDTPITSQGQDREIASIENGLHDFADSEIVSEERKPLYIHFMVGDIVIDEVTCISGDKLRLPDLDTVAKAMGNGWNADQFVGWDSDGIAHDNSDIKAILKRMCKVQILMHKTPMCELTLPEGTKVSKALTSNIEKLNLKMPLTVNYSIYCKSRVVTDNLCVTVEPKNEEAGAAVSVVVVFAVKPSQLGIDITSLTKEQIKEASIIQRVSVPFGSAVEPPSDALLAQHGIRLPFDSYYTWSADLSCIKSNIVIKVVPKTVTEKSSEILSDITTEQVIEAGKSTLKSAIRVIKYPALLYMERKLLKEFERSAHVRMQDFIFLRRRGDLMLYKYTGVSPEVEIPAVVNGMYVKYIHPEAFTNGPFKMRNLFNKESLFSTDRFDRTSDSISSIVLPKTIRYLPKNFLYNVSHVKILTVPESVTEISPNAFTNSCIDELYFDGRCPRGFERDNVDALVYVRREYYKSFFG